MAPLNLALTANDARSDYLFAALGAEAAVRAVCEFDKIDPITKYAAALLSYDRPRSEWWENYQMHPLVQRRRQKVLQRDFARQQATADALLMWGSWFQPTLQSEGRVLPFFNYIDQSRTLAPLPGEPAASILHRRRSFELQARTYAASLGIFTMSEWARTQTLDAHGLSPSKVHAVGWGPCAIDLSAGPPPASDRSPTILHVSNDFHRKGIDFLVATAERLRHDCPEARFVVVGRGVPEPGWDALPNVSFVGPRRGKDLEAEFATAAAFFLPHRFDRSPHVLVEAMSAGLPLVASAQGGAIELIEGRDTGCLAPVGDIDGYASALRRLLQDEALRRRQGANGLALMQAKYNWPTIARTIVGLMRAALDGGRGRP